MDNLNFISGGKRCQVSEIGTRVQTSKRRKQGCRERGAAQKNAKPATEHIASKHAIAMQNEAYFE